MSEHNMPNPDKEYDPDKPALDNLYEAYDGAPPEWAVEFGIFMDVTRDLLDQHARGEISSDEFTRRHNQAASFFEDHDGRPGDN